MADPATTQPYRVLVTGSRSWRDWIVLVAALDHLLHKHGTICVIHGDCGHGADEMAKKWAATSTRSRYVSEERHPADWQRHGKAAGFRRNAEMVSAGANLCLAFIDECRDPKCRRQPPGRHGSHGASQCAELAEKAGIEVRRFGTGDWSS